MVQTQDLMSEIQMGGWSEEEYLLGYDKCSSNTYFNNQDRSEERRVGKEC